MNNPLHVMNTRFKKSWIFFMSLFFMTSVGFALPTNIAMGKVYLPGCIRYFNNPANAFDGNLATVASGGSDINPGGGLAVDFGSPKNLLSLSVTFGDKNRAAQWYKIQVSENGNDWNDILRVFQPQWPVDTRALPSGSHRYLRYVSGNCNAAFGDGESSASLVAVAEIAVFERGSQDPVGLPPPVYPTPLDRTGWKLKLIGGGQIDGVIDGKDQGWCDPHGAFSEGYSLNKNNLTDGNGFEVDMGAAKDFNQVWYFSHHAPMFAAKVEVSNDGVTWDSVGGGALLDRGKIMAPVNIPMQHKRYFRLVSTSGCACWWGITSIAALNTTGSTVEDTGGSINIALNKTASGTNNASLFFDGNVNTTSSGPVKVDLGEVVNVRRIILRFTSRHNGYFMPISISKDNVVWDTVSYINVDWPPQFLAMANYSTRYLKFDFPSQGNSGYDNLSEIEIFKSDPNSVSIHSKKFFTRSSNIKTTGNHSSFIANGKKVTQEIKNKNLLPVFK